MTTQQRDLIINELYHILHELCEDVTEMRASLKNMRASVKEMAKELEVIAESFAMLQQAAHTRQMGEKPSAAQGAAHGGQEFTYNSIGVLTAFDPGSTTTHMLTTSHSRGNLREQDRDVGVGGSPSELAPAHLAWPGLPIPAQTTDAVATTPSGERAPKATTKELDLMGCSSKNPSASVSEVEASQATKTAAFSACPIDTGEDGLTLGGSE
ncbi:hypothetical protein LTR53_003566 [Teratosphaeriaceae sp. CCFEE 6253]|nr:hypothetical protein LTR53_003566 [Teratosphaeriaceae sp. CCFEE 6253]